MVGLQEAIQATSRGRSASTEGQRARWRSRRARMLHPLAPCCTQDVCCGGDTQRRRGVGSCTPSARAGMDAHTPAFPCTPTASSLPHALATTRTRDADGGVWRRAATTRHAASGSKALGRARGPTPSSSVLVGPTHGARTGPVATSTGASPGGVPGRMSSHAPRATTPGGRGRGGGARAGACRPVVAAVRTTGTPGRRRLWLISARRVCCRSVSGTGAGRDPRGVRIFTPPLRAVASMDPPCSEGCIRTQTIGFAKLY